MKYVLLILSLLFNSPALAEMHDSQRTLDIKKIDYLQYNDSDKQVGDVLFAKDLVVGNLDAPVTIIEYYSFSCAHCVDFGLSVVPVLKKKYIDTGKVKLILRDFPLDRASLNASMLLKCYVSGNYCMDREGCNNRDIFVLASAMLSSRKNWDSKNVFDIINGEALKHGMTKDEVQNCLKDEILQNRIVQGKIMGIRYLGISAIPTIFINGEPFKGGTGEIIPFIDNIVQGNK